MSFFKSLRTLIIRSLDPNDPVGVKRVALLLCLLYFIASSFAITIVGGVLSFKASKGDIAFVNVYSVQTALVMKYNFLIVSFLIGAITVTDFGRIMVDKEEAKSPDITVEEGAEATVVQNVGNITTDDVTVKKAEIINTDTTKQTDLQPPDYGD